MTHPTSIFVLELVAHIRDGVGYKNVAINSNAMAAKKCSNPFVLLAVAIHANKERKETVIGTLVIKETCNRHLLKALTVSNRHMKNNSLTEETLSNPSFFTFYSDWNRTI